MRMAVGGDALPGGGRRWRIGSVLGIVLDKKLGRDERLVGLNIAGAHFAAAEGFVFHPEITELGAARSFI